MNADTTRRGHRRGGSRKAPYQQDTQDRQGSPAAEATVQEPASHAMAERRLAMAGAGNGDERRRKRVGLEFSSLFSLVVLSWEQESTHL
jgi:hypothetical protein